MKTGKKIRTYCILTPRLAGMGGAQLYALRRMNFLKNQGHRLIALVTDERNFIMEEKFSNFKIFVVPELAHPVFKYSKDRRFQIIQQIIRMLDAYSPDLILESHTLTLSIWSELIANGSNCKHIIYPLNERTISEWEFSPIKDYFLWKQDRREFIGPSYQSLKLVMDKYFREDKSIYSNIGFDPEELPGKSLPDITGSIDQQSFIIGTISRLSKPYIRELIESVIKVSDQHPDRKITLIVAGDDPDKSILEYLKKRYTGNERLNIIFPGYLNPLGRDFFVNLDLFAGMATAAINSISLECATITVDPISKKSSGFFGLTSSDTMFAEEDKLRPLEHWIEMALLENSVLRDAQLAGIELFNREYNAATCLQKIENYISNSDQEKTYWSFPENYLSSSRLRTRYNLLSSFLYKKLQQIYGVRKRVKFG